MYKQQNAKIKQQIFFFLLPLAFCFVYKT